jgi:hypothetical protein
MKTWSIVVLAVLVAISACGKKETPETPETQVRRTVTEAAAAAERKDAAALRALVSDSYADTQGRDKKTVDGIVRVYFLRSQSLHLFTHTTSVEFPDKNKASVVVYVGMAAQPVPNVETLERLRADLYRFELVFENQRNAWRVIAAEWRSAEIADFIH